MSAPLIHNDHRPGSNATLLSALRDLAANLDNDTAVLLEAATHIRAGISALRKSSRNPVHQQTREEWLQAYDRAPLKPHRGGV